jgi:hypothetical protein
LTAPASVPVPSDALSGSDAEARLSALESAVVAVAAADIARRTGKAVARLRKGWMYGTAAAWRVARTDAARLLTGGTVDVSRRLRNLLGRAGRVGASTVGGTVQAGWSPMNEPRVADRLLSLDQHVTGRLQAAVDAIPTERPETRSDLTEVLTRVERAKTATQAAVGDTVHETATAAAIDAADGDLIWRAERDACLICLSMAGATIGADGSFRPVKRYTQSRVFLNPLRIPAHPRCRCVAVRDTPGMADGLKREAERSIAYGWANHESTAARLRAVDALLRAGSRLPVTVQRRARSARDAGTFTPTHGRN